MPLLAQDDDKKASAAADYFDVSGMENEPRKAAPADIVKTAMSKSRILMTGDTNHFNGDIIALAQSPAMLAAAKDGGATHIAIEVDQGLQHVADKYIANQVSRPVLEQFIDRMYRDAQNNEDGTFTRLVLDTVDFAKQNDMKIVFADPHNGWGNKPSGLSPEEDEKWELENSRDRFRDTELVGKLNNILDSDKNAKIYMAYGDAHFSVDNGNKDSLNGPMTKISLYSDRADLENFEKQMQDPNAFGRKMGWMGVKPDLVYFMDEGTFATTNETSNEVKNALKEMDAKSTIKPSNTGFTSSTANYGLDDDKRSLTSGKAFNQAASGVTTTADQGIEITSPALQQKAASNAASYLSTGTSGP